MFLVAFVSLQPPVPVTLYVIVAVPAAIPVINPLSAFTVATAVSLLAQLPPEFPFDVKVVVPEIQIFCVPDNVPAFGAVAVVTTTGLISEHPEAVVPFI